MWCEPLQTESHPKCESQTKPDASKMFVFGKALCLPALTDQRLCLLKMSRILVHKKHAEVDSLVKHKGFC